ncbi:MAG: GMC family oxidoreductase N-terminal domain-containing protein [Actinobacteria bacterium]|nr:GMC family oxidoreductase N-terminal domain-containing protein [Actinomycetota bacterium]
METESYDYVVVGSGSAGCAAAGRLAELSGARVCVVEAGPPAKGRLFEIPTLFSQQLKSAFDWDYQTEPEPQLGGRRAHLPRGRAVGGTSSMNTMAYVRGNAWDYDNWRALGNEGWGYEDVLPFFKRSEDNERGADDFHGVGGPLTVSDARSVHPLLEAWVEAGVEFGYRRNPDFNGADQEGFGVFQTTQRDGRRCSSAVAFLEPAGDNLTVLHSTLALRIRWDGTRAAALEVDHDGEVREIGIDGELVISAGAYNSPHLLLQSGVGDPDELRAAGLTPAHPVPEVGKNLRDHAGCFLSFLSDAPPVLGPDTSAEEKRLLERGDGPMAWCEAGAFLKTSEEIEVPDIQMHAALGITRDEGLAAATDHGISWGPYVARTTSLGAVEVRHPHPYAKPRIRHSYLSDPEERRLLRRGLVMAMELADQNAVARHLGTDLKSSAAIGLAPRDTSEEALDEFIAANAFSFYHGMGTCAMGHVVDARLRVHGLDNVRVADTSVMPAMPTGNLNAPAIMIGERVADFVKNP